MLPINDLSLDIGSNVVVRYLVMTALVDPMADGARAVEVEGVVDGGWVGVELWGFDDGELLESYAFLPGVVLRLRLERRWRRR